MVDSFIILTTDESVEGGVREPKEPIISTISRSKAEISKRLEDRSVVIGRHFKGSGFQKCASSNFTFLNRHATFVLSDEVRLARRFARLRI
jgi:hypothetical protein